jgi:hypothetical protein
MSIYPLIDFFPLFDGPLPFEIEQNEQAEKFGLPTRSLKPEVRINNHLEFLLHTISNYSNSGAVNSFRCNLLSSSEFAEIKRLTPYLKDIPSINQYRNIQQRANLQNVDVEIKGFGSVLPAGQTIFHGGSLSINKPFITSKPLSLTYCPEIALWHADNDLLPERNPNPVVWILKVDHDFDKKAVIFKKGGSNMANEFEVLIESGVTICPVSTQTKNSVFGDLEIIEAKLTNA